MLSALAVACLASRLKVDKYGLIRKSAEAAFFPRQIVLLMPYTRRSQGGTVRLKRLLLHRRYDGIFCETTGTYPIIQPYQPYEANENKRTAVIRSANASD
jgi:hypothetical protein